MGAPEFLQFCCTAQCSCRAAARVTQSAVLLQLGRTSLCCPEGHSLSAERRQGCMLSTHRRRELRRGEGREEEGGMGMGKRNCQLLKTTREGAMERSWAAVFLSNAKGSVSIDSFWTCCRESWPRVVKCLYAPSFIQVPLLVFHWGYE